MEPVNYGLIFSYGVQMTLVFVAGLLLFTTLVMKNEHVAPFYYDNRLRLTLIFANFWVIAAGLVTVPQFSSIFGSLGFNAEQSPVGIAIVVILAFLRVKTPTETPETQTEGKV